MGNVAQVEALRVELHEPPSVRTSRWQLLFLAVAIVWLYHSIGVRLAHQWWTDPDFSHGFFVPLFSLYVVWQNRSRLASLPQRPSWLGLPVIAVAMAALVVGNLGAELFLSRVSFLFLLAGLILFFQGPSYFRALLFPWAFLILMIPIPVIIFNEITFPLQILASKVAGSTLPICDVPVFREGNVMHLAAIDLEVAEACSGIRSLLSLTTLAIIYGYLVETRNWVRVALAVAAVPIAVVANSLRIIGTGLIVQYWDKTKAEGFLHTFQGWLIFVVSLIMLFLVHKLFGPPRQIGAQT